MPIHNSDSHHDERFKILPLSTDQNRSKFNSNSEPLDKWFREQAGQQVRKNVTRVFTCIETRTRHTAGFYSLSAGEIQLSDLTDQEKKQFRAPRYSSLPVVLLGRLAVDQRYQGHGIGNLLMVSALKKAYDASKIIGISGVIVDAKDSRAAEFYLHQGFQDFAHDNLKLFVTITKLAIVF